MTDKEIIYRTNVQRSLVEMYQHMETMLEGIPEGIEECDLTPEHELQLVVYHYMWETRRDFGHACAI